MISLDGYYSAWNSQLKALKVSSLRIKALPSDAQHTQAMIVRNACLVFIKELEENVATVVSEYNQQKEKLFAERVHDIHVLASTKKPWPLNADLPVRLKEERGDLAKDGFRWAEESVHFETAMLGTCDTYLGLVHKIIGELVDAHKVPPLTPKKR